MTSAEKIMAFTEEQLKSGLVANQLQKNVSGSARWGQKLNTNDYPLLGSADEVYLDGNLTMNCLGELEGTGTPSLHKRAHLRLSMAIVPNITNSWLLPAPQMATSNIGNVIFVISLSRTSR